MYASHLRIHACHPPFLASFLPMCAGDCAPQERKSLQSESIPCRTRGGRKFKREQKIFLSLRTVSLLLVVLVFYSFYSFPFSSHPYDFLLYACSLVLSHPKSFLLHGLQLLMLLDFSLTHLSHVFYLISLDYQ